MESQIDIIARELGMDPVEFRMKNLLDDGDATPFGQKLKGIVVKEISEESARYFRLEKAQGKKYRPRRGRLRTAVGRGKIRRGDHY